MATATESNLLEAQPRTAGTKNDARRVRREGKVPAVLYGAGKDSVAVSLDPRQVSRILHSQTGYNTIFDLALDGAERTKAMIVEYCKLLVTVEPMDVKSAGTQLPKP